MKPMIGFGPFCVYGLSPYTISNSGSGVEDMKNKNKLDVVDGILKSGANITCFDCKDLIATTAKDLNEGLPLTVESFFWKSQRFEAGQKTFCKKCGVPWFSDGNLHTENGWFPNDPHAGILRTSE